MLVRGAVAAAMLLAPARVDAAPVEEDGILEAASARFAEAQRALEAGDHDGAIAALEAGLAVIPEGTGYAPTRARMLLLIVATHAAGFRVDSDLERLHRARRLLDQYLGPLDLLDEQGRGEAEEQRSLLIAQIAAVEAERRRANAERAAVERRQRAEAARRQARTLRLAGAATTSLGIVGVAVVGAGLGVGRSADRRIDALAEMYGDAACEPGSVACEERYAAFQDERRRGNAGNVMVVAGAVAGAVFLVTGTTLLLVARKRDREARGLQVTPAPVVGRGGFGVALEGRF